MPYSQELPSDAKRNFTGFLRYGDVIVPIKPAPTTPLNAVVIPVEPATTPLFDQKADPFADDFPVAPAPVFAPPTRRTIYTNDPKKRGF